MVVYRYVDVLNGPIASEQLPQVVTSAIEEAVFNALIHREA